MKKFITVTIFWLCLFTANAQPKEPNPVAVGFHISQIQRDFGLGINITTPKFARRTMAVRARAIVAWTDIDISGKNEWKAYYNATLGVVAGTYILADIIELYGEGGALFVFPGSSLSSETVYAGGYGLFGFSFHFGGKCSYFIEIGGAGSGARKDKLLRQPVFSNGMLTNVGFRLSF